MGMKSTYVEIWMTKYGGDSVTKDEIFMWDFMGRKTSNEN